MQKIIAAVTALGTMALLSQAVLAEDMTGVTATEIKVGNTVPYSGPAAPYGTLGRAMAAYFDTVNKAGGIAGHKIVFISRDDAYSPPKTVEQTRKLVEEDQVAFIYGSVGTAANLSVRKYLNEKHVPQLSVLSGASTWNDPKDYPWSMSGIASYELDGRMVAAYVLKHTPNAKIAVIYQNDDFGRDHFAGLKKGLGAGHAAMLVNSTTFETTDPTVDSQTVQAQASGADTLYIVGIPKLMAQVIRKADALGWKPLRFITYTGSPVAATPTLAGLQIFKGTISHNNLKDPQDPQWADDPEMKGYVAWMNQDYPKPDIKNGYIFSGWSLAASLVDMLKLCNGNFSREHVMYIATHLHDFRAPGLLPGITLSTSPTDYSEFQTMRNMQFDGARWVLLPADESM
ncbi:MAG TPA: ABC transporter substrate-binding protein [Stellaceae bacterium]|nr:ABC transporter substrate-binding protein [Stellaceae bacterium]